MENMEIFEDVEIDWQWITAHWRVDTTNWTDIRDAGNCPCCDHNTLVSYTYDSMGTCPDDKRQQYCGYYCPMCAFSAAGSRQKNL